MVSIRTFITSTLRHIFPDSAPSVQELEEGFTLAPQLLSPPHLQPLALSSPRPTSNMEDKIPSITSPSPTISTIPPTPAKGIKTVSREVAIAEWVFEMCTLFEGHPNGLSRDHVDSVFATNGSGPRSRDHRSSRPTAFATSANDRSSTSCCTDNLIYLQRHLLELRQHAQDASTANALNLDSINKLVADLADVNERLAKTEKQFTSAPTHKTRPVWRALNPSLVSNATSNSVASAVSSCESGLVSSSDSSADRNPLGELAETQEVLNNALTTQLETADELRKAKEDLVHCQSALVASERAYADTTDSLRLQKEQLSIARAEADRMAEELELIKSQKTALGIELEEIKTQNASLVAEIDIIKTQRDISPIARASKQAVPSPVFITPTVGAVTINPTNSTANSADALPPAPPPSPSPSTACIDTSTSIATLAPDFSTAVEKLSEVEVEAETSPKTEVEAENKLENLLLPAVNLPEPSSEVTTSATLNDSAEVSFIPDECEAAADKEEPSTPQPHVPTPHQLEQTPPGSGIESANDEPKAVKDKARAFAANFNAKMKEVLKSGKAFGRTRRRVSRSPSVELSTKTVEEVSESIGSPSKRASGTQQAQSSIPPPATAATSPAFSSEAPPSVRTTSSDRNASPVNYVLGGFDFAANRPVPSSNPPTLPVTTEDFAAHATDTTEASPEVTPDSQSNPEPNPNTEAENHNQDEVEQALEAEDEVEQALEIEDEVEQLQQAFAVEDGPESAPFFNSTPFTFTYPIPAPPEPEAAPSYGAASTTTTADSHINTMPTSQAKNTTESPADCLFQEPQFPAVPEPTPEADPESPSTAPFHPVSFITTEDSDITIITGSLANNTTEPLADSVFSQPKLLAEPEANADTEGTSTASATTSLDPDVESLMFSQTNCTYESLAGVIFNEPTLHVNSHASSDGEGMSGPEDQVELALQCDDQLERPAFQIPAGFNFSFNVAPPTPDANPLFSEATEPAKETDEPRCAGDNISESSDIPELDEADLQVNAEALLGSGQYIGIDEVYVADPTELAQLPIISTWAPDPSDYTKMVFTPATELDQNTLLHPPEMDGTLSNKSTDSPSEDKLLSVDETQLLADMESMWGDDLSGLESDVAGQLDSEVEMHDAAGFKNPFAEGVWERPATEAWAHAAPLQATFHQYMPQPIWQDEGSMPMGDQRDDLQPALEAGEPMETEEFSVDQHEFIADYEAARDHSILPTTPLSPFPSSTSTSQPSTSGNDNSDNASLFSNISEINGVPVEYASFKSNADDVEMSDGSGDMERDDVSLEDNNAHSLSGDAGMAELCGAFGGMKPHNETNAFEAGREHRGPEGTTPQPLAPTQWPHHTPNPAAYTTAPKFRGDVFPSSASADAEMEFMDGLSLAPEPSAAAIDTPLPLAGVPTFAFNFGRVAVPPVAPQFQFPPVAPILPASAFQSPAPVEPSPAQSSSPAPTQQPASSQHQFEFAPVSVPASIPIAPPAQAPVDTKVATPCAFSSFAKLARFRKSTASWWSPITSEGSFGQEVGSEQVDALAQGCTQAEEGNFGPLLMCATTAESTAGVIKILVGLSRPMTEMIDALCHLLTDRGTLEVTEALSNEAIDGEKNAALLFYGLVVKMAKSRRPEGDMSVYELVVTLLVMDGRAASARSPQGITEVIQSPAIFFVITVAYLDGNPSLSEARTRARAWLKHQTSRDKAFESLEMIARATSGAEEQVLTPKHVVITFVRLAKLQYPAGHMDWSNAAWDKLDALAINGVSEAMEALVANAALQDQAGKSARKRLLYLANSGVASALQTLVRLTDKGLSPPALLANPPSSLPASMKRELIRLGQAGSAAAWGALVPHAWSFGNEEAEAIQNAAGNSTAAQKATAMLGFESPSEQFDETSPTFARTARDVIDDIARRGPLAPEAYAVVHRAATERKQAAVSTLAILALNDRDALNALHDLALTEDQYAEERLGDVLSQLSEVNATSTSPAPAPVQPPAAPRKKAQSTPFLGTRPLPLPTGTQPPRQHLPRMTAADMMDGAKIESEVTI